jgi:hemoglobin-like flavoprotein
MSFVDRIRRAILGPSDTQISQISQALGGPSYPIPPFSVSLPTDPTSADEWMPDTETDLSAAREATMTTDQRDDTEDGRYVREGRPETLADAPPAARPIRDCPHCRGTGRVLTIRDHLDKIVAMLPEEAADKDALIAEFYRRLLASYPYLAFLFPKDLTTGDALNSKGNRQRDQLWGGLEALLTRYDPDRRDSENMRALTTALEAFGRDHSAFLREDGTVEGATEDEYIAVRNVLLRLCQDALGEAWLPEHTRALVRAYRFAMVKMMNAAEDNPMTAVARSPRR